VSGSAQQRDDFERVHARLSDAELDAIAGIAGFSPAIGRLNFLDDRTLEQFAMKVGITDGARVVDIGCGRGFFGRWLLARGFDVGYTGVDVAPSALEAARGQLAAASFVCGDAFAVDGEYDVAVLIESVWSVDEALARHLRAAVARRGTVGVALTSLDASHDARVAETENSLALAGFATKRLDVTMDCEHTAGRLSAAALIEGFQDPWVRERMAGEALAVLAALREKSFRSELIFASVPT
jgi:SAM-dependent methyltransferase